MIQFALHIEHTYKNKTLRAYKINSSKALTVIGSNKNADIQLIGNDIEGIHATIELDKNTWTINDVSGESGVWIKKEPVLNFNIKSTTLVNISGHTLKLTPHYTESKLFSKNTGSIEKVKNQKSFHQIVVKKFGFVVETHVIKPKKSFFYKIGTEKFEFKSPTEYEWKVNDFKNVSIHQRLVYSDEIKENTKDKIFALIDPSLKIPMGVAFAIMLLFFSLVYFVPQQPELNEITKNPNIKKNKFTKIIYKAKTKKEKKKLAKAKKILLKGKANKKTPAPAPMTVAKPAKKIAGKGGGSRTFTKSNKKRISQLLGKITKRASQNAQAIETAGVAATTKKTLGPGLSAGTRIANIAPTGGGNGGKSKGISGVKTGGKAGGKGTYRGLSGFSTGSIGGSNVGIIEEETEIAGGLTKEQISRVIKRNLGQIRYCYERQLSSNPDLYGKILVDFSIGATGKITKNKIKKTTLGNSMVEGCILRKMAKWKFPNPVGGTTVKVTYPFLFKSTN